MKTLRESPRRSLFAAGLIGAFTLVAFAGGGERLCPTATVPNGGTVFPEKWASIPSNGIPWQFAAGPGPGTALGPGGFPSPGCYFHLPESERPGLKSLFAAAAAWTDVPIASFPPQPGGPLDIFPYPMPAASAFKLETPTPLNWNLWTENDDDRMIQDQVNLVTLWQPETWWTTFGGPLSLAAAWVYIGNPPVTQNGIVPIAEADIALNVRSTIGGVPAYCFVEQNPDTGNWWSTQLDPATFDLPALRYVDFQGTLTHDFGHFAGVEHSLVDSHADAQGSEFPTMFTYAQVEPFNVSIDTPTPSCGTPTTTPVDHILTGRSARTLQLDDIAAVASTYPTTGYQQFTGSISGKITRLVGATPVPVLGAHVLAFRHHGVSSIRVGILSDENGDYQITGLPSGSYYVRAELPDQNWNGTSDTGYYFPRVSMPNFIALIPGWFGCLANGDMQAFGGEFWDVDESYTGTLDHESKADLISVTQGNDSGSVDIELGSANSILRVRDLSSGASFSSTRGVFVIPTLVGTPPVLTYPQVRFDLSAGAAYANRQVTLIFGFGLDAQMRPAGLVQVAPGGGAPANLNAVLDGSGNATLFFQTSGALDHRNIFIQAAVRNAAGNQIDRLTNIVNVWMTRDRP